MLVKICSLVSFTLILKAFLFNNSLFIIGNIMNIISVAHAAEGAPAPGGDMSMLIILVVCMVAVYFFVMRPNNKKRKEMQNLLDGLAVGDEVLTNGGIAGKVVKLPENKDYVMIGVGKDVVLQMKRNYIVAVLPKGTIESM